MSWHYLQGQEEASWEGSCLDGAPSALSSLMPIADPSCSPGSETESCPPSRSGMTCGPSTGDHGEGASMSSAGGSRVRTLAQREKVQGLMVRRAGCGRSTLASLGKWDPDTCSWRTPQCSLLVGLDAFSETWPRWGMMRNGECWEQMTLDPVTREIDYGSSLQTPTKSDQWVCQFKAESLFRPQHLNGNLKESLMQRFRRWITPSACEMLLMWPVGWSDLQPLAMDKFQQWFDSHGKRSEAA